MVDMSVKIGSVTLKNPIMPASGCFSTDLAQVIDLNRLGALVAKTVSREFRAGNPPPRVSEVEGGMINSIGLPTKGIDYFLSHQVPEYKRFSPPLVGSISATTIEDFEAMARDVSPSEIDVLEVNISCPTRDPKGGNFALHEEHTFNVMRRIRATTDKPIWCKLSPNAGDVVAIARAAEADKLPLKFEAGVSLVQEVWAPSEYCKDIYDGYHANVNLMPFVIERDPTFGEEDLGVLLEHQAAPVLEWRR